MMIVLSPFPLVSCIQEHHEEAGGFESSLEKQMTQDIL